MSLAAVLDAGREEEEEDACWRVDEVEPDELDFERLGVRDGANILHEVHRKKGRDITQNSTTKVSGRMSRRIFFFQT